MDHRESKIRQHSRFQGLGIGLVVLAFFNLFMMTQANLAVFGIFVLNIVMFLVGVFFLHRSHKIKKRWDL